MADGGHNNSTKNGAVELEAKLRGSFSWHPCHVSLSPNESGLIVKYEDKDSEEVIKDKDDIISHIRMRSAPLQGDDCTSLQQGSRVLATQSSDVDNGVFCDAQVEKVVRVRHSKRINCRCSFTIKWIDQPFGKELSTVPASAVMKLSEKDINLHPVISTFFSLLESSTNVDGPIGSKFVDSVNWEMDINVLLEKQLEEISNFTDNKITNFDSLLKDPKGTVPLLNNLNGSTWSENKKQRVEISVENHVAPISSIQEGLTGNRLPLSPLAARAALASLRSVSNSDKGDITSESIVKTLFPTSETPQGVVFSDQSPGAKAKGSKKKNMSPEKKLTQPSETRVTRSRIQKNNGIQESSQNGSRIQKNNGIQESSQNGKLVIEKDEVLKRKTNSATREEAKEHIVQPKVQRRKIDFSESNDLNLISGSDSTKSKKVQTTTKTTEGIGHSQSKKNIASSKKQERRFSLRLKVLSQTTT